jgi:hypothetical protein
MIHLLKVVILPLNHYFLPLFYPLKPIKTNHERLTYAEQLSTCPAAWAALAMLAGLACPGWRLHSPTKRRGV